MASILFRSVAAGGARPAFEFVEERRRRAVQSPDDEPQRRHRQINERAVRTFKLRWEETNEAQVAFVRTAFDASFGGVLAMDFTPMRDTDANAVEVCFVDGTLEIEQLGPLSYVMELELEEQH